jgi:hypothetical protein
MFWQIKPHRIICRGNQNLKKRIDKRISAAEQQFYKNI